LLAVATGAIVASMLPFTKMEGAGNDFLVVDLRAPGSAAISPEAAVALCDRRFGVGGDGVLAIEPASRADAVARMRVHNADGSEAEMCGNGIRCVARYLHDHDPALRRAELPIETGAGLLRCALSIDRGRVGQVAVQMGRPRLQPAEIPIVLAERSTGAGPVLRESVILDGRTFTFTAVSMGNPHAVCFLDGAPAGESLRSLAERFGPSLERHPMFPRRTNAEFARCRSETEIDLVVWERGCGITMACGTGACATAVAACLEGRARPEQPIAVHLPGGTLSITVAAGLEGVTMRGPAEEVYTARVDADALVSRSELRGGGAGVRSS
jgi:diaminopimelate epimerase